MNVHRIFIKGDCHGDFRFLDQFCSAKKTTQEDLLIILGDAGINYWVGTLKDLDLKENLKTKPITLFCIHGNHEERPYNIPSYQTQEMFNGTVYAEPDYPNIIFAKDGENYEIGNHKFFVLGGAYSIDKWYRIIHHHCWYPSEQPDERIKQVVAEQIKRYNYEFDIVLSHTAPLKYEPIELFLSGVDQSKVDKSTEKWLDDIESSIKYKMWYFGHYHGDLLKTPKMRMLYHEIIELDNA